MPENMGSNGPTGIGSKGVRPRQRRPVVGVRRYDDARPRARAAAVVLGVVGSGRGVPVGLAPARSQRCWRRRLGPFAPPELIRSTWEPSLGGFPALSTLPGQFLIKDLALLGISLWSLGEPWDRRGPGVLRLTVRQLA